jgi:hypothetical protein
VQRPELKDLLSVVAVNQTQSHGDVTLTLLSLEQYADGVLVLFRAVFMDQYVQRRMAERSREPRILPTPHLPLTAQDDLGNAYHGGAGGGSCGPVTAGEPSRWRMTAILTPTFANGARSVHIAVPELQMVDIGTIQTPPFHTVRESFLGPWVFDVRLPFQVRLAVIVEPEQAGHDALPDLQEELNQRPHWKHPRTTWDARHGYILVEIMEEQLGVDVAATIYAEEVLEVMSAVVGKFERVRVEIMP